MLTAVSLPSTWACIITEHDEKYIHQTKLYFLTDILQTQNFFVVDENHIFDAVSFVEIRDGPLYFWFLQVPKENLAESVAHQK